MKKLLLILLTSAFTVNASAIGCGETQVVTSSKEEKIEVTTAVPKELVGSTVTLILADGTKKEFKSEEFMVVKRKHLRPVIKETTKATSLACTNTPDKNIVSLKAIDGYSDVTKTQTATTSTLKVERQVGFGLQYQRNIYSNLYLGGEVDSNNGVGLLLGVGF